MSGKEQLQADKTAETSMKHHEEKQDILGQMETVNYLEFVWIDDLKIKRRYGKESKIGSCNFLHADRTSHNTKLLLRRRLTINGECTVKKKEIYILDHHLFVKKSFNGS